MKNLCKWYSILKIYVDVFQDFFLVLLLNENSNIYIYTHTSLGLAIKGTNKIKNQMPKVNRGKTNSTKLKQISFFFFFTFPTFFNLPFFIKKGKSDIFFFFLDLSNTVQGRFAQKIILIF